MAKEKTGIHKELKPSKELAVILGSNKPISRGDLMGKAWKYIKKHDLQNPKDKREILCDAALKAVIGHSKINMLKMGGKLFAHLS
jgi:upstream activation factor subunit UAF30